MRLIADISVVLAWFFDEQQSPAALSTLKVIEKEGLLVPPLWWTELENGILMGEHRARKNARESGAFMDLVRALPIETDGVAPHRISHKILEIARQHKLTAYDATYLELADRQKASLATFDAAMRLASVGLGIQLFLR